MPPENKTDATLSVDCRVWIEDAIAELQLCATHHPQPKIQAGEALLARLDAQIKQDKRDANASSKSESRLRQQVAEIDGAIAVFGGALTSVETMVKAAKAIERAKRDV